MNRNSIWRGALASLVCAAMIATVPVAPSFGGAAVASSADTDPATVAGRPSLLLGTAWYPEAVAGVALGNGFAVDGSAQIHFVRITEFAWSKMEPLEGKYDFDWLDPRHRGRGEASHRRRAGHAHCDAACLVDTKISGRAAHRGRRPASDARQSRARVCDFTALSRILPANHREDWRSGTGTTERGGGGRSTTSTATRRFRTTT